MHTKYTHLHLREPSFIGQVEKNNGIFYFNRFSTLFRNHLFYLYNFPAMEILACVHIYKIFNFK